VTEIQFDEAPSILNFENDRNFKGKTHKNRNVINNTTPPSQDCNKVDNMEVTIDNRLRDVKIIFENYLIMLVLH